jgi:hypothetical protein
LYLKYASDSFTNLVEKIGWLDKEKFAEKETEVNNDYVVKLEICVILDLNNHHE